MSKTHWKKTIDPNWIGVYVLPNEEEPINVTITHVENKSVEVMGQQKVKTVAYFAKNQYFDKPMILNPTNMSRMRKLAGSPYLEDWKNIRVTLQREMDKAVGGGKDWALRIATKSPELPTLQKGTDNWNAVVDFIKKGGEVEKIQLKYKLNNEVLSELKLIKDGAGNNTATE